MKTTRIQHSELPKTLREINAVLTLVVREIKITLKSPARLCMTFLWPVLMFGMFGNQLSQNMGTRMGYNFSGFMLIGMLVNSMFMMVMQGIGSLAEDRQRDFTQEIFVAPVSRYSIILGKIIGAAFPGYLQYFSTILIGLLMGTKMTASAFCLCLAISPIMCLAAGSIGVLIVGCVKNTNSANILVSLGATVQMFASGAMTPINHSSGVMAVVSHLMPMTYAVDLARGLCYSGTAEFNETVMYAPWINLCVVLCFTAVFFLLGTWQFVRSEKNK